jgi:DNA polymerase-3 subunit epsilon
LIIHNADFDVGFLDHELALMEHPQPRISDHCKVLDTLSLARDLHPGQRNSLDALCKRYEVDASKRDVHGALIDSELLALVYLAMTGGQSSLLLDDDSAEGDSDKSPDISDMPLQTGDIPAPAWELVVVEPTADEIAAHEALLAKMRESGACVWDFD